MKADLFGIQRSELNQDYQGHNNQMELSKNHESVEKNSKNVENESGQKNSNKLITTKPVFKSPNIDNRPHSEFLNTGDKLHSKFRNISDFIVFALNCFHQKFEIQNFDIISSFGSVKIKNIKGEEFTDKFEESIETFELKLRKRITQRMLDFLKLSEKLKKDFQKACKFKFKDYECLEVAEVNQKQMRILRANNTFYYIKEICSASNSVITDEIRFYTFKHKCILPLLGWCNIDNKIHYVYPYYSSTFEYYLQSKRFKLKKALEIIIKILNAYAFINSKHLHYDHKSLLFEKKEPVFYLQFTESQKIYNERISQNKNSDVDREAIIIEILRENKDKDASAVSWFIEEIGKHCEDLPSEVIIRELWIFTKKRFKNTIDYIYKAWPHYFSR